jgi:putative oxidoreductase
MPSLIHRIKTGNLAAYSLAWVRIPIGFHLIYGTQDNVFSWPRMLEFRDFRETFAFPEPLVCAVISVYIQFICGILYVLGYQAKIASVFMIFNFLIAFIMVHPGDPYPNIFPAIMMFCGSVCILLSGPDKLALDSLLRK